MGEWIGFIIYLVVSIATYIGLLRLSSREFGVCWFTVLWSLCGFIPAAGQVILLIVWLQGREWDGPEIPRWLRRLAGDSVEEGDERDAV